MRKTSRLVRAAIRPDSQFWRLLAHLEFDAQCMAANNWRPFDSAEADKASLLIANTWNEECERRSAAAKRFEDCHFDVRIGTSAEIRRPGPYLRTDRAIVRVNVDPRRLGFIELWDGAGLEVLEALFPTSRIEGRTPIEEWMAFIFAGYTLLMHDAPVLERRADSPVISALPKKQALVRELHRDRIFQLEAEDMWRNKHRQTVRGKDWQALAVAREAQIEIDESKRQVLINDLRSTNEVLKELLALKGKAWSAALLKAYYPTGKITSPLGHAMTGEFSEEEIGYRGVGRGYGGHKSHKSPKPTMEPQDQAKVTAADRHRFIAAAKLSKRV